MMNATHYQSQYITNFPSPASSKSVPVASSKATKQLSKEATKPTLSEDKLLDISLFQIQRAIHQTFRRENIQTRKICHQLQQYMHHQGVIALYES
jgi:hypothetical protein